ncbi:hypothetical protein M431DRAFT_287489 [Trichoderma harzianum CBS 226.95]|uniref:Uncharacterized protein n=1 Tax=Trichoderma harzianum CBS 226.95 TaxID=983964 RepID=A0A2T4AP36_TRIHA|nr:hypothetical protein M431DRAFT_287489 [Trichoderma harzianum CBS 226.95]PTB58827.1 hypothetical protein M431DRAFT_287489 [Trichoderma harzianum CBS 226.95]
MPAVQCASPGPVGFHSRLQQTFFSRHPRRANESQQRIRAVGLPLMQTRADTGRSGPRTPSHCLVTPNQLIVMELKPEPVEVLVPSQRTPCLVLASRPAGRC